MADAARVALGWVEMGRAGEAREAEGKAGGVKEAEGRAGGVKEAEGKVGGAREAGGKAGGAAGRQLEQSHSEPLEIDYRGGRRASHHLMNGG